MPGQLGEGTTATLSLHTWDQPSRACRCLWSPRSTVFLHKALCFQPGRTQIRAVPPPGSLVTPQLWEPGATEGPRTGK